MAVFRFKQFEVTNNRSAMKVNTDGVLLGAAMTIGPEVRHMLDIGTGTGTIALMAAQRCSSAEIDAIDIDPPSAEEAAANFAASPWSGRLHAHLCPLSGFSPGCSYDLIFSNPPYYDNSLTNPDRRESEARHSLSLSYRDILVFAAEHLSEEGSLSMILPADCEKALLREAAGRGLYPFRIISIRTTPAKQTSRIIAEFGRSRLEIARESLVIQEKGRYTQEYISLTGPFYYSL